MEWGFLKVGVVHLCEICGTPLRNLWYTSAKFVVHLCEILISKCGVLKIIKFQML
jgi:hypothetical protein